MEGETGSWGGGGRGGGDRVGGWVGRGEGEGRERVCFYVVEMMFSTT